MNANLPTLETLEELGPKRAAAFWLEHLQRQEPSGNDSNFREWLAASEANRSAWDQALELWDSFEESDDDDDVERMRREALTFRPRRITRSWFTYGAAASIAAAASVFIFLNVGQIANRTPNTQVAMVARPSLQAFGPPDYSTTVGERRTFALSDGTKLTLDTNSAVDVAYLADKRLVRLVRGQAFFDVVHNAAQPFRVAAGERIITVLGTRFNVRVSSGETRVILDQGSIGVSKGTNPAIAATEIERLSPGQELIARAGQADQINRIDADTALGWRRGFVQFDGQTLGAAIEEMNRYTDRKIVIQDPSVASLRISGAFPADDTDRFVQTLTALYPVRVVPARGGKVEIVHKG